MPPAIPQGTAAKVEARRPVALRVWLIFLAALLVLVVVHRDRLMNPTGWDPTWGMVPAAATLAETGGDLAAVIAQPSLWEGGANAHATSTMTWLVAAAFRVLGADDGLLALHLLSLVFAAGLATAAYCLLSPAVSLPTALLGSALVLATPLVLQQAADVYIDLPLALVATLAMVTAARHRLLGTTLLVLLAVSLKSSGVMTVPLLIPAFENLAPRGRRWGLTMLATGLAVVPLLATVVTAPAGGSGARRIDIPLTLSGIYLAITIDVLALALVAGLATFRSRSLPEPAAAVRRVSLSLVAGFVVAHLSALFLTASYPVLPRYYLVIVPALVGLVSVGLEARGPLEARVVLAAFLAFAVANSWGALYPLRDPPAYVATERSLRAQYLIDLAQQGASWLSEQEDRTLVVDRPMWFRLRYPESGYVDRREDDLVMAFQIGDPPPIPDRFALVIEQDPRHAPALAEVVDLAREGGFTVVEREITSGPFRSRLVTGDR